MPDDIIVYQFSRSKVERCDFGHFLSLYAPDKLPTGRRLRLLMDSMVFCIEGYDDDPREIHAIPEVRRFYSAFHAAWPYWLYFCSLDVDVLRAMVACCLPSLTAGQVDGQPTVLVKLEPLDLLQFLRQDFAPMNAMCERGQMLEPFIFDRKRRIFEHFALPFDASARPAERL
jgi:hypothetical protein